MKSCWALALAAGALSAQATVEWNGVIYPQTQEEAKQQAGFVYMTEGDPTSSRASSYTNYVRWSDQHYPHGDARYYVGKSGSCILDPGKGGVQTIDGKQRNNHVFYGKSLVIGTGCYFALCATDCTAADPVTFGEEGLVFANGTFRSWVVSSSASPFVRGPFVVLNDADKDMVIDAPPDRTRNQAANLNFLGDWHSLGENQVVEITRQEGIVTATSFAQGVGPVRVFLHGDTSGYQGLFAVETNCFLSLAQGLPNGSVQLGRLGYRLMKDDVARELAPFESGLNGELTTFGANGATLGFKNIYSQGGTIYVNATNKWNVTGTLRLKGGILRLSSNAAAADTASLTAADLVFEDGPKVNLQLWTPAQDSTVPLTWKVLSAPKDSFTLDSFRMSLASDQRATIETDGETSVLVVRSCVKTTGSYSYKDNGGVRPSPWDSAQKEDGTYYWTDHLAPHPEADYYMIKGQGLPCTETHFLDKFQGRSLTAAANCTFTTGSNTPVSGGLRVDDFRLEDGCLFQVWAGDNAAETKAAHHNANRVFRLAGNLTLLGSGETKLMPFDGTLFALESNLHGAGTILMTMHSGAYSATCGAHEVSGDNSDFAGGFYLTMPDGTRSGQTVPSDSYFLKAYFAGSSSLGGPMPAFCHDAIRIDQYSWVSFDSPTVLDQANRGLCVQKVARFNVTPANSFTVKTPLTLQGQLRVEGNGVLALGGKLRFGFNDDLDDATAPTEGNNKLMALSGGLKPLSTNAWDGAEVCVASTGWLAYDVNPAAPGMKEYGPVNVRWTTPLSIVGAGSTVAVRFDVAAGASEPTQEHSVALGTFANATVAQSVLDRLVLQNPYAHLKAKAGVRGNADGTATVVCTFWKPGLMMILK